MMSRPYVPTDEEKSRLLMTNMLVLLRCKSEKSQREKYPPVKVKLRDGREIEVYDATYRFIGIRWMKAKKSDTYETHAELHLVHGVGPKKRYPNTRGLLMDSE